MNITRVINGQQHTFELTPEEIRRASSEYDEDSRVEDIICKVKETIGTPFGELCWFSGNSEIVESMVVVDEEAMRDAADGMAYSVERNLGRNDCYWDAFWESVRTVISEELYGTEYDADDITVGYRNDHIHIMVEGRVVANVAEDEVKIIDFDFFASEENRQTVAEKLAELESDIEDAA